MISEEYFMGPEFWPDFVWDAAGIFPDRVNVPPLFNDVLAKIAGVDKDEEFDVIVAAARPLIFNFDYQRLAAHQLSNADKEYIELAILNHFVERRISSGNLKKWKHWFRTKIQEIMPLYCDMLWSMKLEYNPLYDHELWDEWDSDGTNDTQETGTLDSTVNATGTLDTSTRQVTDEEGSSQSTGTVDTTVDKTGTLDTETHDTSAETTHSESSGTQDSTTTTQGTSDTTTTDNGTGSLTENDRTVTERETTSTESGSTVTDETDNTTGEKDGTTSGTSSGTTSGTKSGSTHGTESESHNDSRNMVDRYSDTPQSDAEKIWEITYDTQGRPVARLTDIYLTNIRGVTESTSGSSNGTKDGTSSETTSGTESGQTSGTTHEETETNRDHDVRVTDSKSVGGTEDATVTGTKSQSTTSSNTQVIDNDTTGRQVVDAEHTDESDGTKNITASGTVDTDTTERQVTDTDTTDRTDTTHDSIVTGTVDTDTTDRSITDTDTTNDTQNQHHDEGNHHYWGTRSHTYQSLVKEYRENLLHLIGMICDELEPLFYGIVETDDFLDFV